LVPETGLETAPPLQEPSPQPETTDFTSFDQDWKNVGSYFIMRLRRIQKGVETAFSLPRMVVPPNIQERGKRRGILCSKTRGQNHGDSVLL
jgi:hypothetical protein